MRRGITALDSVSVTLQVSFMGQEFLISFELFGESGEKESITQLPRNGFLLDIKDAT